MASAKIISFADAAIKRAEEQQRAERDDDVRAIIEFMVDELNNIRDSVELLRERFEQFEQGGEITPVK